MSLTTWWQLTQTNRGLLANLMAWEELKQDVAHLAAPNHRDEWHKILEQGQDTPPEEVAALEALATILQKRAQRNFEWLAIHQTEVADELPPVSA